MVVKMPLSQKTRARRSGDRRPFMPCGASVGSSCCAEGSPTFQAHAPAVENGLLLTVRLGYDWNEWWTLEGSLHLAPYLEENMVGETTVDESGQVRGLLSLTTRMQGDAG